MADLPLIIEDGSGKSDADSYVSVAEADAYHQRMGNGLWSQAFEDGTDIPARKDAALRKAAVFLDGYVLSRVTGARKSPRQGLLFPRAGMTDHAGAAVDEASIPQAYKAAQCEAALLVLLGTQLTVEAAAGPLLRRRRTGELEKEWIEDSYCKKPVFGWLDSILSTLLGPAPTEQNGGATRVVHLSRG